MGIMVLFCCALFSVGYVTSYMLKRRFLKENLILRISSNNCTQIKYFTSDKISHTYLVYFEKHLSHSHRLPTKSQSN